MEPVNFPRSIRGVNQADRVKRMTPREDRGQDGAFQRHLRRQVPGTAPPEDPEPEPAPPAGVATDAGASPGAPEEGAPRQIDIRI
ncbi:MAG: hypothetical protein R6V84_07285 [Desulfobacterales bacterium]